MRTSDVTASLMHHLEGTPNVARLTLGEIALDGDWGAAGRIDVVALTFGPRRTFSIDGYEVKVSRSDFTKDVDQGKILKYRRAVDRLYYAAPVGVIRKEEVPAGIGLLSLSDGGRWQTVRRADIVERTETGQVIRMLRRMYDDRRDLRALAERLAPMERLMRMFSNAAELAEAERMYGFWLNEGVRTRIQHLARDEERVKSLLQSAQLQLDQATTKSERMIEQARRDAADINASGPTLEMLSAAVDLAHQTMGRFGATHLTDDEAQQIMAVISTVERAAVERRQHAIAEMRNQMALRRQTGDDS